ncbi:MAG: hypothetical protein AAF590_02830 [Pseudomonadota bacterium]
MAELLQSGRLIDGILVLVIVEALVLFILSKRLANAPCFADLWPTLASGLCLMLALRFTLDDSPWTFVAGALLAALIVHVMDIYSRFRRV